MGLPTTPAENLWRHYWAELMAGHSRLSLLPLELPFEHSEQIEHPPPVQRARRPAKPYTPRVTRSPAERAERRIERDIERVKRLPVSEWAKRIAGDERNNPITLQDILDGVENYFELFEQMRRMAPDAYQYFSRVGAPLATEGSRIRKSQVQALTVVTPAQLPSLFGIFYPRTREQQREETLRQEGTLFDFHLFEKPKNHATVAPLGSTIFHHHTISLKRDIFTPDELRQFPGLRRNWGMSWYVGVLPDGTVRALPHRMSHRQRLPSGDSVYHSAFEVPSYLHELGGEMGPHAFVREWFNIAVAFTASALSGVTVTIRQGKRAARIGVPVSNLKAFFTDRDVGNGERRKAILHFRPGHDRHMADGRIIAVGEHLSGERHFTWRGYEVTVGVPGIHFPSPEGFDGPIYIDGDPENPLPPEAKKEKLMDTSQVGDIMRNFIQRRGPAPIRRGQPVRGYSTDKLDQKVT